MAKATANKAVDGRRDGDNTAIINALRQVTDIVSGAAQELAQLAQSVPAAGQREQALPVAAGAEVNSWDDPFAEAVPTANPRLAIPFVTTASANNFPRLRTSIVEPQPAPGRYAPGTPEFRYWVAAEALTRGINFWGTLLPAGTTWSASNPMRVTLLDQPDQLNAKYSRPSGLIFYHQKVANLDVYAAESPDVVCHELGHAVLDALRPELFNAANTETAAFHESFGDMSAVLCALQSQTLRQRVIADTGGRLNTSSSLSRLAEQLGWAMRQLTPTAVDDDCLRNAANRFFYSRPDLLPPTADANLLSTEEHSFSRVFTGAFLDALARMYTAAASPDENTLVSVSRDMGQLLIDAVYSAPITTDYMCQVAAGLVQADQARFSGRNKGALTGAFLQHGILSIGSIQNLANAAVPSPLTIAQVAGAAALQAGGGARVQAEGSPNIYTYDDQRTDSAFLLSFGQTPELALRGISIADGLDLQVHATHEPPRFDVKGATFGQQGDGPADSTAAARLFVEGLIQRSQVDLGPGTDFSVNKRDSRVTHAVAIEDGKSVLWRQHFSCACHGSRAGRGSIARDQYTPTFRRSPFG